jgi:hypothetical protein
LSTFLLQNAGVTEFTGPASPAYFGEFLHSPRGVSD